MGTFIELAKPGVAVAAYAALIGAIIKGRVKAIFSAESSVLKRLVSCYATFALAHHLYKIYWVFKVYCRAVVGWRKVPGEIDRVDMPGMRDNLHRL